MGHYLGLPKHSTLKTVAIAVGVSVMIAAGWFFVDCRRGDENSSDHRQESVLGKFPNLAGMKVRATNIVYVESHGKTPQIIMAVWADGLVVWSKDDLNGGPPYYKGKVSPERLRSQLAVIDEQMESWNPSSYRHRGHDSSYTVIRILSGGRSVQLESWHELAEGDSRVVATGGGLEPLNGRNRASVLAVQDMDYRTFREIWEASRMALRALVPEREQETLETDFVFDSDPPVGRPVQKLR